LYYLNYEICLSQVNYSKIFYTNFLPDLRSLKKYTDITQKM